ncbi:MAG TPA: hypothetical protein VD907_07060 [Verrucomicrobiae bacterium]|nr:hypothetical protein [Verrucomicrobiae bacterium]
MATFYPEDDDLDLERELERADEALDMMARDMRAGEERRHRLRKQIAKKQLDPLVAKAIELAHQSGQLLGANEGLGRKIENLVKRIEVRDQEIERTADRDDWKARALTAEATIERSKKRRRK